MRIADFVRYASVAVVLLSGSCAAPTAGSFADPTANHPIAVEPHYAEAEFAVPSPSAGLNPSDASRFGGFVADFLEKGKSQISISVPDGPDATDAIAFFGEKLASLGVPRSRILVGTHTAEASPRVKIGYVDYTTRLEQCGDWSKDVSYTVSNTSMPNFGCATQHNIAVQVENTHDLAVPRPADEADAARRADVVGKYEKGTSPATQTSGNQGTKIPNIGNQQ